MATLHPRASPEAVTADATGIHPGAWVGYRGAPMRSMSTGLTASLCTKRIIHMRQRTPCNDITCHRDGYSRDPTVRGVARMCEHRSRFSRQ